MIDDIRIRVLPDMPEWMNDAECLRSGIDKFFVQRGESINIALAYCHVCPVREECLEYALTNNEQFGIWGGKSNRQRQRLRATHVPSR